MMSPSISALIFAVVSAAFTMAEPGAEGPPHDATLSRSMSERVPERLALVTSVASQATVVVQGERWTAGSSKSRIGRWGQRRKGTELEMEPDGVVVDPRLDSAAVRWVEETLSGLTVREKVAQMVMPWIPGGWEGATPDGRRARRMVGELGVGGLIVGKGPGMGTVRMLNELQRRATVPLLVAADLEWGAGTRLEGATELPVNMAIAATGDLNYVHEAGRLTAREARAAGIHMAFAPVADVNINASNPVINTRSYGGDPIDVAERVASFVEGAEEAGLLTAAKHFPGHGDTESDSHLELPVVHASRARLSTVELVPFRAAIAAGVTAIMTAHVAVPAFEPDGASRPATLSPAILNDLLRREMGFDGLIVTDGLMMDGVHEGRPTGEVAVEAVQAGADILLMPPGAEEAIDAVVAAVEAGLIDEARIDASVRRILGAKAVVGLHEERFVDLDRSRQVLGAPEHLHWAQEVADRSVTLVRSDPDALPFGVEGLRVVHVVYADARRSTAGEVFDEALAELGAKVETHRLWRRSSAADVRRAERAAARADFVVFSSFARAVPWKGSLAIPERVAELGDRLAAHGAAIVGFGDPYLLEQIPRARTYLLAWSNAEVSQRAAARALGGRIQISGRLPIPLPPYHALGEGIITSTLAGELDGDGVGGGSAPVVADQPMDHPRDAQDQRLDRPDGTPEEPVRR